jgi:hypothetical protein
MSVVLCRWITKKEWQDLKHGWPIFIDEIDRMFPGVTVTGDNAFVPGATRHLNFINSDEEEAPADYGTPQAQADYGTPQSFGTTPSQGTPVSSGSKRSVSSLHSTATSPGKKPKNAAVRGMNQNMSRYTFSYDRRTELMERSWSERKLTIEQEMTLREKQLQRTVEREEKRKKEHKLVTESATKLGVHLMDNLWVGVLNIGMDDQARHMYLHSPDEGKLQLIKTYATRVVNQPPPSMH